MVWAGECTHHHWTPDRATNWAYTTHETSTFLTPWLYATARRLQHRVFWARVPWRAHGDISSDDLVTLGLRWNHDRNAVSESSTAAPVTVFKSTLIPLFRLWLTDVRWHRHRWHLEWHLNDSKTFFSVNRYRLLGLNEEHVCYPFDLAFFYLWKLYLQFLVLTSRTQGHGGDTELPWVSSLAY